MIISKRQLTCHAANVYDGRPELSYILFTRAGAVSTDGKCILRVPYPKPSEGQKNECFGTGQVREMADAELPEGGILVHAADAKLMESMIRKQQIAASEPNRLLDTVEYAAMNGSQEGALKEASIACFDHGISRQITLGRALSRDFPLYERVIPPALGKVTMMVNAKALASLLSKIVKAAGESNVSVELRFDVKGNRVFDPVQMFTLGKDPKHDQHGAVPGNDSVFAVFMPMR